MQDTNQNEPIDLQRIQMLQEAGIDLASGLLKNLVQMFIDNTTQRLSYMEMNLALNNLLEVAKTAHDLKSSCGTLGANRMMELATLIEYRGRENRSDGLAEALRELRILFPQAEHQLTAFLLSPEAIPTL
jgi:HPt (histidine-containing phosphotransfer) domain-containing protein